MKTPRSILALSLGLLGLAASHASAQTVITSAPYVINASGKYILGGNLSSSSTAAPAILVNAPNVILDLDGYYVAGPGNPAANVSNANTVIYVADVANVTIKNGTVAGNATGIYFGATTAANSRNFVVDGVTITRCYIYGVNFASTGAPGSIIRNSTFSFLGNSTITNSSVYGINLYGGVLVKDCIFANITANGTGSSYGIDSISGSFSIGNVITGCGIGIINGKFLNNLTGTVTTPFSGGINATGNN